MTDRELLELAAKAAGIDHGGWLDYHPRFHNGCFFVKGTPWNPLTNDGDALRLAVKLNMAVYTDSDVSWIPDKDGALLSEVRHDDAVNFDPYAATRRAIVRAAAEIGKEMK